MLALPASLVVRAPFVAAMLCALVCSLAGCSEGPDDKALSHYRKAMEAANEGDFERSVIDYSAGIQLKPTARAYLHRGFAWMMLGKFDFARVDFLRARRLEGQNAMAAANLALLALRDHDLDAALTYANSAVEYDPKLAYGYATRAEVYEKQGHLGLALADYNTAVTLDSRNAVLFNNRGVLQSTLGNDSAAYADYSMAIKLDPDSAMCLWNRGMVSQKRRQLDKAVNDYSLAALREPEDYSSYVLRGAAYEELGEPDRAESDFREAKRLNPAWEGPESILSRSPAVAIPPGDPGAAR